MGDESHLKQIGRIDRLLLDRVDERRKILGQTRRVFVERALRAALIPEKSDGSEPS